MTSPNAGQDLHPASSERADRSQRGPDATHNATKRVPSSAIDTCRDRAGSERDNSPYRRALVTSYSCTDDRGSCRKQSQRVARRRSMGLLHG